MNAIETTATVNVAPTPSKGGQRSTGGWRLLLRQQDWAVIVLFIVFIIATGITKRFKPAVRPSYIYDATISLPMKPDTMAGWVAPLVPGAVFAVCVFVCELAVFRGNATAAQAWAAVARQGFGCLAALVVVIFLTNLFKLLGGRLRPDFIDRCQPLGVSADSMTLAWGQMSELVCSQTNASVLENGHVSFPSGHSSMAYSVGWYGALYLCWCFIFRGKDQLQQRVYGDGSAATTGLGRRVAMEALSFLAMLVLLFQLAWPWGVGVSRFRDNRHNVSDVVAGFLLAVTFTPVFLLRTLGQQAFWLKWEQAQAQRPLLSASGVLPL